MFDFFKNKSPDFEKLKNYGFKQQDGEYAYSQPIMDGQLVLHVRIKGRNVSTRLVDTATDEDYTLHLVASASGEFVGEVRRQYSAALEDIALKCWYTDVFISPQARAIIAYVSAKYGDELEFLWDKLPDAAVLRRKDTSKWYAVFMKLPLTRLGIDNSGMGEIADVRIPPEDGVVLIDGKSFFAAYHMNKKHWITAVLDGRLADGTLFDMFDKSYTLAK